jgi:hypothetical protein
MTRLFYSGPSLETLHQDYAKQSVTDAEAQVTATASTEIGAPAPAVWQMISDVASWPDWHPAMQILELSEVRPDAPFRWKTAGITIRSVFALVTPGRELTWTGRFMFFKAVGQRLVEPLAADRTRVSVAESIAGPLLPLLYSSAKLRAGHEQWLADLRRRVEADRGPAPWPAGLASLP